MATIILFFDLLTNMNLASLEIYKYTALCNTCRNERDAAPSEGVPSVAVAVAVAVLVLVVVVVAVVVVVVVAVAEAVAVAVAVVSLSSSQVADPFRDYLRGRLAGMVPSHPEGSVPPAPGVRPF